MKQVLIYSGTTEGRILAEHLAQNGVFATVCVATEYGSEMMQPHPNIQVREGRMDADEMRAFVEERVFDAVVDATHPYAVEVSRNIKESMKESAVPCYRLLREMQSVKETAARTHYVKDAAECGAYLKHREGAVLLTTGSKELGNFLAAFEDRSRLYVRVLPAVESIEICKKHQIPGKQVIAMQGPFSREMNEALLRQYHIRYLVTKESGTAGGFSEKEQAAAAAGAELVVIGRPEEKEGYELSELFALLTGKKWKRTLQVALIGAGMGRIGQLTGEAQDALERAQVIFGAKRLLEEIGGEHTQKYPYYLAKDILPWLAEHPKIKHAAVLFSGDTGFYSGAEKIAQALKEASDDEVQIETVIYPGISSVSYFAARLGIGWQDAALCSIHGREKESMRSFLMEQMKTHRHTFLLLSGAKDVPFLGTCCQGMDAEISLGYELSYPKERILKLTPRQCEKAADLEEGLYLALIENHNTKTMNVDDKKKISMPGISDEEFLREKIPMTKQEVRQISIARLALTEEAVVYDIGSGSGSVSVEIARLSSGIRVYAIEQKKEALALTMRNAEKFGCKNIIPVEAKAPEKLETLPVPTHAFIGGSSGCMEEILTALYQKNPKMHVVINAITLETVGEIIACMKKFEICGEQVTQLSVARGKQAGNYHLMQAENPVHIFSFTFDEREEKE